ncbi:MAG: TlyA family RNA methyltransferase [Ideonella sp.]
MRADQLILQRGLAPTRSAAQRLITAGAVRWLAFGGWTVLRKAGEDLPEDTQLDVTDDAETRWVSRGGLKLDAALQTTGVQVEGRRCLDVGQSTGGFTDVLLTRGAVAVVGVDVGHGQLHAKLREDVRVTAIEGLNARELEEAELGRFELVVGDLSFISMTLVLPAIVKLLTGDLLMLVKPQFELQPVDISKGGLVKDVASYPRVEQRIREACAANGLDVIEYLASAIDGGDGNREFFVWARSGTGTQGSDKSEAR